MHTPQLEWGNNPWLCLQGGYQPHCCRNCTRMSLDFYFKCQYRGTTQSQYLILAACLLNILLTSYLWQLMPHCLGRARRKPTSSQFSSHTHKPFWVTPLQVAASFTDCQVYTDCINTTLVSIFAEYYFLNLVAKWMLNYSSENSKSHLFQPDMWWRHFCGNMFRLVLTGIELYFFISSCQNYVTSTKGFPDRASHVALFCSSLMSVWQLSIISRRI